MMKMSARPANSFTILGMKRIATLKDTEGSFIMGQGKYMEVLQSSVYSVLKVHVEEECFYIQLKEKVYQRISPLLQDEMTIQFIGKWNIDKDAIIPLDLILVTEEEEFVFQVE